MVDRQRDATEKVGRKRKQASDRHEFEQMCLDLVTKEVVVEFMKKTGTDDPNAGGVVAFRQVVNQVKGSVSQRLEDKVARDLLNEVKRIFEYSGR
jgi:hypothetical protein